MLKRPALLLAAALTGVGAYVAANGYLFDRAVKREIDLLVRDAIAAPPRSFSSADLEGLPAPVQRYFRFALAEGQSCIRYARSSQTGMIRLAAGRPWLPLAAEQYLSGHRPGFLWRGRVGVGPLWIEARDKYEQGRGNMLIKLASAITLGNITGPEMDVSSLVRWLAEAPMLPTALLPSAWLRWEAIDDHAARAIVDDGSNACAATFSFDDQDAIVKSVTDDRYREAGGRMLKTPWITYYRSYRQVVPGLKAPTEGEVEWLLPEGTFSYIRIELVDVRYNQA